MITGLYNLASAMVALEQRQEIVANNVANMSTSGYKRSVPILEGFYQELFDAIKSGQFSADPDSPGGGVISAYSGTNFSQGALRTGCGPLDVALEGDGFFTVSTPDGVRYTRDGAFKLDSAGRLVNSSDYAVLSESDSEITISGSNVIINPDGGIVVDGGAVERLGIMTFPDLEGLEREGQNLYRAPQDVEEQGYRPEETRAQQYALEVSNVEPALEILEMTLNLRSFEAAQLALKTVDETLQQRLQEVQK